MKTIPRGSRIRPLAAAAAGALLCLAATAWGAPASGPDEPPEPASARPPFKSAIITYELSGVKTGTKTLYIKGNRQAVEENGSMLGTSFHVLTLIDEEVLYTINPTTGRGTKMQITPELRRTIEQSGQSPMQPFVGQNVEDQLKKEVGRDRVLDRDCSMREALGQRICVWAETVPLRSEGNLMGIQFREVATKIEENVDIPDERFQVPPGTQIQEIRMPTKPQPAGPGGHPHPAPAANGPSPGPPAAAAGK